MKYYKVVRAKNKKLVSGNTYGFPVRYIIGKWTYPQKDNNQWLYVTTSFSEAAAYASASISRIYECKIGKQLNRPFSLEKSVILTNKVKLTKKIATGWRSY